MSTPSEAGTGVIHDIGYRHYTGPRLGRGPVVTSLYLDTLRGAFGLGRSGKSKIAPFLLLALVTVPALATGIIVNVFPTDEPPFAFTDYVGFVYVLLCLFVAGQAPAAVSRDLRFRTTSLYFSRPLARADYVSAKFAGLTTAVAIVLLVPLVIYLLASLLSDLPTGDALTGFAQSLLGVVVISPLLAGISLALASVTPRRGIGVASITAVLIVLWGVQGTVLNLMISNGREDDAHWANLISPDGVVDQLQRWAFDLESLGLPSVSGPSGLVFAALAVALIVGSYGFLRARYAKVSVS